jgi:hypothetical protein
MKKLLILFLLSNSTLSFSQVYGELGSKWFYSESAAGGCPGNCEYVLFQSVLDTIIQSKNAKKITQTYFQINGDTIELEPIYVYTNSDTVYYFSLDKNRFLSLFIFNQQIGDTLHLDIPPSYAGFISSDSTYRLVIDDITNHVINGVTLKRYKTISLDNYQFYNNGYFMDRIGGLDWLFPRGAIFPEAGGPIRCYSDNDIDTSFQSIPCDYLVTDILEYDKAGLVNLYPNPVNDYLHIDSKKNIIKIHIYNSKGKLIKNTTVNKIDFSIYSNGIYLCKVFTQDGKIINQKIIKE